MKIKNQWNVEIIKNITMKVFGIEMVSSAEKLDRNIKALQKTYSKSLKNRSRKRQTVVTRLQYLDEERIRIIVAGYVKEETFKEYQISASISAVVTVRGYSDGKINRSIRNIRAFFFQNWIEENKYQYKNMETVLWTKERQSIFVKNTVQVMFLLQKEDELTDENYKTDI